MTTKAIAAYKKDPNYFKQTAKNVAKELAALSIIAAGAIGIFKVAVASQAAKRDLIERLTFDALVKTKNELVPRGLWKSEYFNPLVDQYRAFFTSEFNKSQYRK